MTFCEFCQESTINHTVEIAQLPRNKKGNYCCVGGLCSRIFSVLIYHICSLQKESDSYKNKLRWISVLEESSESAINPKFSDILIRV